MGDASRDGRTDEGLDPLLPAARFLGRDDGMVTLLDPVAGLPFAVHGSRMSAGSGWSDLMVSPYGAALDVSAARREAAEDLRPYVPSLAWLVADAASRGHDALVFLRSRTSLLVRYARGDVATGVVSEGGRAWCGPSADAAALLRECYGRDALGRPGAAHPSGVVMLRASLNAEAFLFPGDAVPLSVPPTLEGLLAAAASTGAPGFTLSVWEDLDILSVDRRGDCALPAHRRVTWQGDVDDARRVIREAWSGSQALAAHGARVGSSGGDSVRVRMPPT